jgi:single-strand DNA-binding protein
MDINQVTLVGRLADNVLYTPEGETSARAVGRLIVNRPPSKDGQRRYDAIQLVAWGRNAEIMAQYTSKGKELGIKGEIRVNSIPPQKEGDDWKNYFEGVAHQISLGRDSNQAKMMKAIQGGASAVNQAMGTAPGQMDMSALLQSPQVLQLLQAASASGQAAKPAPAPAENPEGETVDFIDEKTDDDEAPFSTP